LKRSAIRIVFCLLGINAIVLVVLLVLARAHPSLLGAGILAMSFGLRHSVDADHIAAIDNVTRRLIDQGKRPLLVGFWFSIGHSSIVFFVSILTAFGSAALATDGENEGAFTGIGALISTLVSACVLLLIGLINLVSLIARARHSQDHPDDRHTHDTGGWLTRCCPVLLTAVDAEWKMAPLGFIFGLGFETSSEVALLALAAMSPTQGIPPICTLVLPLLFAGGMSIMDTLDGLLMSWAYSFAATSPDGRQLFNVYLTATSSLIAISVGLVELLGALQTQMELEGPFWDLIGTINDQFEYLGYAIIAFFAVSTIGALVAITSSQKQDGSCGGFRIGSKMEAAADKLVAC